jgi:cytochrome c biogenesis protein CcmG/thiol:disulfide interchange protein DsbE
MDAIENALMLRLYKSSISERQELLTLTCWDIYMFNYMKRHTLLQIMALALAFSLGGDAFAESSNAQATDFDLPGKQANVKLSNSKGKLVYLDFWASWCGPCKQSFPWMNAMQEKYQSQGLEVIAINLDENNDDAQKFLASTPAKFTVAFDAKGQIPRQYGVKGMPTSYLISRDGKIIFQHMGFNVADREKLEQKIRESLEDKKMNQPN